MTPPKTALAYRAARSAIGTQRKVAQLLEVTNETISNRERGRRPINMEAALAIQMLPIMAPGKEPPK